MERVHFVLLSHLSNIVLVSGLFYFGWKYPGNQVGFRVTLAVKCILLNIISA